ncbi:MAG: MBL fold metallo-hydrolase [Burkholderiales bacterium]|jgi:hydroxyacylglutathione hydrolase|nr:MBL fold metallo-hydrolase [Burkholderiales bacterium]
MLQTFDYKNGIHAVDIGYERPLMVAVHLVVDSGRVAIIDAGHNRGLEAVLRAMERQGLSKESVDYLCLTHVHLDHAGGAGRYMQAFPNAQLVVHERGARHMINPGKLIAGAREVYGDAETERRYGELVPVSEDRVMIAHDGERLRFGRRELICLDTPGHAKHHLCYHDPAARGVFTGDVFGSSFRELDVGERQFVIPISSPVQFDPLAMHASIERILALEPEAVYLTHFSQLRDPKTAAADLHRLIDAYVDVTKRAEGSYPAILDGLWALYDEEAKRQGWTLSREAVREMLRMEMEINAQGLEVWFKSQAKA